MPPDDKDAGGWPAGVRTLRLRPHGERPRMKGTHVLQSKTSRQQRVAESTTRNHSVQGFCPSFPGETEKRKKEVRAGLGDRQEK